MIAWSQCSDSSLCARREPGCSRRPLRCPIEHTVPSIIQGQGREALTIDALECIRPLWCGVAPSGPLECSVQLRAHGEEHRAVVVPTGSGFSVSLRDPASGIAPGQACVVYDGTRVVGSGTIAATSRG